MSNDVKLCMLLQTSNRCYAPNNRTINLLMKGKIHTNAVTGGVNDTNSVMLKLVAY